MKVMEYLKKAKLDIDEFAVACDISISTMYKIIAGGNMSYKTARKIEIETGGDVSIKELMKDDR